MSEQPLDVQETTETQKQPLSKQLKILIVVGILVLLSLIGYLAYAQFYPKKVDAPVAHENHSAMHDETGNQYKDARIRPRQSLEQLTTEEFQSEANYYINILNQQDPREALTELRKDIETDQALLRSCHAITHMLGHEAYRKYGDFDKALVYLDEVCNTGYMHGVIEKEFAASKDIYKDMATICDGHDEGRCFHGVGHGVMFLTENDLPKSLSMCETYPKLSSQLYCSEGVFMENFNVDQKNHLSEYLSSIDFFYPCSTQKEKYKYPCYYYAPLHYLGITNNSYEQALEWCNSAESKFVMHCIRGVAAVAIKENISQPKIVEDACMTTKPNQIPFCVDGFVGLYLNHYNSVDKAYQLCDTLQESNQKACRVGVKSRVDGGFGGEVKGASI